MEVSIIITTYKRKEQFKNALFSAINQLFNCEFEIIVVDDNGRNEYTNYVKKTIDEFNSSKVKLVAHEINSNGAVARNSGIKNSNGKYICFLDDDDIYHNDKIQKQYNFMRINNQFDASYCWRYQKGIEIKGSLSGDLSREILLEEFTPTTPCLMFTRQSLDDIGGFNETFLRHQDYEILLKFFKHGYKINYLPKLLVTIGYNEGENVLTGKKLIYNKLKFLNEFEEIIDFINHSQPGFKNKVHSQHWIKSSLSLINRGEIKLSLITLIYALRKSCFWSSYFLMRVSYNKIKFIYAK